MFDEFARTYGDRCFVDSSKLKKIRHFLYRKMHDHGGYRDVMKRIAEDALKYHTVNANVRIVTVE